MRGLPEDSPQLPATLASKGDSLVRMCSATPGLPCAQRSSPQFHPQFEKNSQRGCVRFCLTTGPFARYEARIRLVFSLMDAFKSHMSELIVEFDEFH